jgi:predicted dehydrogenase
MAASKVKVGVVGVGALGRHHARLYKLSKKAEVVGVFDVNEKTAKAVGDEFGLAVFKSPKALAQECDALSVAVPATKHHDTSMPLLKIGKHLLIEKPIAATVEEAREIVQVAEEMNLVLGVGHVERFNPAMDFLEKRSALTRFVEAHRLANYPPPRRGLHRRGTEVGVVLDLMIHDLDLILTMIDCEIEHFDAVGIPVLSKTEDIASVRIKFTNGSVANLTASRVSVEPMRRFRVFQTDCYISMDYAKHSGMIIKKKKLGMAKKDVNLNEKNALQDEIENFVSCVAKTRDTGKIVQPRVSGAQGLKALELAVKITEEIHAYNDRYEINFA